MPAQFQPGVVCRGKLTDPDGVPVQAGLTLTSAGNGRGRKLLKSTLSNRNGDYTFESVPAGRYRIDVVPLFSETRHTFDLTVPADRELIGDFTIQPAAQ